MYDLTQNFGKNDPFRGALGSDDVGPNGGEFSDRFPNVVMGNKGPFDYGGQRLLAPQRPKPPMGPPGGMPGGMGQPAMGAPSGKGIMDIANMQMGKGPMRV